MATRSKAGRPLMATLLFSIGTLMASTTFATSGGGGGGTPRENSFSPSGGGGCSGRQGVGVSAKALAAWKKAGGCAGTGKSYEKWFEGVRKDMDSRQEKLTSSASWAGWGASFWNLPVWGASGANTVGKVSQFGLSFVPGVGKLTSIGLDAARGAAEGYGKGVDKGLSQGEAMSAGAKTGFASGLFSAFTQKLGFAKDAGKALKARQAAVTTAKIARTNKNLGVAAVGTTVQEGIKDVVGSVQANNIVNNSAPQPRTKQD